MKNFKKLLLVMPMAFIIGSCSPQRSEVENAQYDIYKLAQEAGFEGTFEEWLASIQGPKGDKGDKGDTGETGAQGQKGDKGDKGDTGAPGADGKDGTSFISGNGAPTAETGKDGDTYIDLETWDVYTKADGAWSHAGNVSKPSTPIEKAIEAIVANESRIASGTYVEKSYSAKSKNFAFGSDKNGAFYTESSVAYSGGVDTVYYVHDSEKNIVSFVERDNGTVEAYSAGSNATEDYLRGPSVKPFGYSGSTFYGPVALVEGVYNQAVANINKDASIESSGSTYHVKFGLPVKAYTTSLYVIDAHFSVEDSVLSSVSVGVTNYNNSSITLDDETGIYTVNEDATGSTTTYEYHLTAGYRSALNRYNYDNFFYRSFGLADDASGEEVTDAFKATTGKTVALRIVNPSPATGNSSIDKPSVTVTEPAGVFLYASTYNNVISFTFSNAGTYTTEIKTKNFTKTIVITVEDPAPETVTGVSSFVASASGTYYNQETASDEMTVYEGSVVRLAPSFDPYNANQAFTATAVGENASDVTIETESINTSSWGTSMKDVAKISFAANGTYSIKLASTVVPTLSTTVTIHVVARPTIAELTAKKYVEFTTRNSVVTFLAEFKPNEDANTGSVAIAVADAWNPNNDALAAYSKTYGYTYNAETMSFTLTDGEAEVTDITLAFNNKFELTISITNEEAGVYYGAIGTEYKAETFLSGEWSANWTVGETSTYFTFYMNQYNEKNIAFYDASSNQKSTKAYTATTNEDKTISVAIDDAEFKTAFEARIGKGVISSIKLSADYKKLTMAFADESSIDFSRSY